MANGKTLTVNSANTPHIRVGLKWEPREIDHIKFITASNSAASAYFKIATEAGFSAVYGSAARAIQKLAAAPKIESSVDASADAIAKMRKARELYKDFKGPAYNLDLLCFKYDKNRELVGLISPNSIVPKNPNKAQLAIQHSGDDPDGVGVGFDEEILVALGDIDDRVASVFFVVSSENHGFDKIKGGMCSLIRTKDETELLKNDFASGGERQTLIFAGLRRAGGNWSIDEISDFITVDEDKESPLDDTIDDILRNRYC